MMADDWNKAAVVRPVQPSSVSQQKEHMPVSGLVFNLADGPEGDAALAALRTRAEFLVGERTGNRVPAALDTDGPRSSRAVHDWIMSQPGVKFVDVISVNFEGDESDLSEQTPGAPAAQPGKEHPNSQA